MRNASDSNTTLNQKKKVNNSIQRENIKKQGRKEKLTINENGYAFKNGIKLPFKDSNVETDINQPPVNSSITFTKSFNLVFDGEDEEISMIKKGNKIIIDSECTVIIKRASHVEEIIIAEDEEKRLYNIVRRRTFLKISLDDLPFFKENSNKFTSFVDSIIKKLLRFKTRAYTFFKTTKFGKDKRPTDSQYEEMINTLILKQILILNSVNNGKNLRLHEDLLATAKDSSK